MIDKYELQKLRDLPIEGVAERLGLHVSHHKSLCPFHATDRHPSMSYHVGRNICRCFVCMNEAIGPIDLVMRHLNLEFKDAARWLADENNMILTEYQPRVEEAAREVSFDATRYERFFMRPWLSAEAQKFLFDERKLDPRVISWCRITSWRDRNGVPWLQIPYYDVEGRLIGVQNRNLGRTSMPPLKGGDQSGVKSPSKGDLEGRPRFRFVSGCKPTIYNMPMLRYLKPNDVCWIAEGSSDCWSIMSSPTGMGLPESMGSPNSKGSSGCNKAIAIASATLLQPKDKKLLQEITARLSIRWTMSPDNDAPGAKLFEQLKKILPNLEYVPLPEGCKDYSDAYLKLKKDNDNG